MTINIMDENPTNGRILRTLFKDFNIDKIGDTVIMERHEPYCRMQFDRTYWNAPFRQLTCADCIYYEPHKCRMGQEDYSADRPLCKFAEI